MTPIHQTKFGPKEGNCFSAAVASLLDRELDTVPFFMDKPGDWWEGFQSWCVKEGYSAIYYPSKLFCEQNNKTYLGIPDGYSLMSGESPRYPETLHTVVAFNAITIHDPFPNTLADIGFPRDYITLVNI